MDNINKNNHSTFWGVMVIAGTVIGGGMFALPIELSGAWFLWSSISLIITWFLMLHSGLLLLEANLNFPIGSSFNTVTKNLLGTKYNILNGISVLFVLYILTYAYISANGAIITETVYINTNNHINPKIFGILSAFFVASVLWASSLVASRVTSLFLGIKIISFVVVFGTLFFKVDYSILIDSNGVKNGEEYFPYIFMALPVCLASFGFHGNIPSLIICYGKENKKLINSLLGGSLLALILYLFWLYNSMGNLYRYDFKEIIGSGGNVDSLVKSFLGTNPSNLVSFSLLVFSNVAVASSFFGVTLGLFDYIADLFKLTNSKTDRLKTILISFLPPSILYLIFPNGFIYAIGGAGLFATIWAVITPALLALKSRQKFPNQTFTVWGGKVIPILIIIFGIIVMFCWFGANFGLLPKFN